jgi:5-carboxymethyl-2-hydroxymuconate isomerase
MAEGVGFEPTEACTSSVFKTDALNHSTTLPCDYVLASVNPLDKPSISHKLHKNTPAHLFYDPKRAFSMPHAVLEYSVNADNAIRASQVVDQLHKIMLDCGLFTPAAIKTRAHSTNQYQVGERGDAGSFAHVTVSLLAGRSIEQRKKLSDAILNLLKTSLPDLDSVTVEIREMDSDTYGK